MTRLAQLKLLFLSICATMTYLVIATSIKSNLFEVSIDEPWFTTTLIDFYLNIIILSAWVIYKEKTVLSRVLWILGFVLTGAVATSLYVVVQLYQLKPGQPFRYVLVPQDDEGAIHEKI